MKGKMISSVKEINFGTEISYCGEIVKVVDFMDNFVKLENVHGNKFWKEMYSMLNKEDILLVA